MCRLFICFAIVFALVSCKTKAENSDVVDTSQEVYHITCFSGGQVVYEGNWKGFRGMRWDFVDVKTGLKFIYKEHNDCYWTSAPFYKANQ